MITQHMMNPKIAYIGDKVVLSCSFNIDSQILTDFTSLESSHNLPSSFFTEEIDSSKIEITNVNLVRSGLNYYTLSIDFIPWTTGEIAFPSYDIGFAVGGKENEFVIPFEKEFVTSITEQNSITQLDSFEAPVLLPGTHYKLYGFIIFFLILAIISLRLLIKHKAVAEFFREKIKLYRYKKNRNQTEKKLKQIISSEISDSQAAQQIQSIMRTYLEYRYNYPFLNTVSSQILIGFNRLAEYNPSFMEDDKIEAAEQIAQVFIRTDYVRYSKNGAFSEGERESLINLLLENIKALEVEQKKESVPC